MVYQKDRERGRDCGRRSRVESAGALIRDKDRESDIDDRDDDYECVEPVAILGAELLKVVGGVCHHVEDQFKGKHTSDG